MSKPKIIALWVLQVLLAAMFATAGWAKVSSNPGTIRQFQRFGYSEGFCFVIGSVEVASAAGLLIPAAIPYAATALMGVMLGAAYSHFTVGDHLARILFALGVLLLLALTGWARRPAFLRK